MRTFLLIFVMFIFNCSINIRNQKNLTDLNFDTSDLFLIDTLTFFQASGDLKLIFNGERFRGKLDIILKDRTNFEVTVYNSLSMILATFTSDEDSVFIEMGESKYRGCLTDTVNSLTFFPPVPFNFSDLIRILTGRILKIDCLLREIKLNPEVFKKKIQCDSLDFLLVFSQNKLKVKSVNFTFSHKDSSWSADFSKFRKGFGENIEIKSNKSDYLFLKLNIKKYIL